MISHFPQFQKFQLSDKEAVKNITEKFPPYCEFSLVSLLTWYKMEIALLNKNLVIKMHDYYDDHTPAYSLLGTTNIDQTLDQLIVYAKNSGGDSELILVPQSVIQAIKNPQLFVCDEDRDMFDYILETSIMRNTTGRRNKNRRKMVNAFTRVYPEHAIKFINLKSVKQQKDLANCFRMWQLSKKKQKDFLSYEFRSLTKLYTYAEQLGLLTIAVYIKTILIGYSIIELTHKPYAISHYMHTDRRYRGLPETLDKFTAEYLTDKGYIYLNVEADLGFEGLRNAKMIRQPCSFLKKYKVRLNPSSPISNILI